MVNALLHLGQDLVPAMHSFIQPSIHSPQSESSDGSCCLVTLETHMNVVYK